MIDYQAHFPEYNSAAPAGLVPPASTPAPSATHNLVAPAAKPADGLPVDEGPSNDPLVGEALLKAMMNS